VADATPRPHWVRLGVWIALVASFAAAGYAVRFSHARGTTHVSVYSFSTFAGGMIQYAAILGVVLLICINRFDLLALRRPASWRRSLALAAGVIVAILAWEAVVNLLPLPQSPGAEQGITDVHWESAHTAAFAANVFLFAIFGPFVEELTFRGAGQSLLRFLGRVPSILLVGVAFGLWHGLLEALLVLIPFGIALAWLRDRTDSVLPGYLVHALFNAAALALIFS
jgi:membrane protease YdiL (CAAX protease family)